MIQLPFSDRSEAGRLLAEELVRYDLPSNVVVLALPRGGVVVGWEVANALGAPLDVVVVRKLGVPTQPELAMGAIAGGSFRILDQKLIDEIGISREEVEAVIAAETAELVRREELYRRNRPALDLRGRTVLLVDDGLATGSTMLVAARYARSLKPGQTFIAMPVGSVQACRRLRKEADRCVCLATPQPFGAVGEWYVDFPQVPDQQVQVLLDQGTVERSIAPTQPESQDQ
jgi:putative phosphoribosyl transferase